MPTTAATPYARYLPWKPWLEIGFWTALWLFNATANSITAWMDIRAWERCADSRLSPDDFEGQPCWIGIKASKNIAG